MTEENKVPKSSIILLITLILIIIAVIYIRQYIENAETPNTTYSFTPDPSFTPISPFSPGSQSSSSSGSNTSWFSGGTLHQSTLGEWRRASYQNRLATSADFVASTQDVDYGDMFAFKQMATDLETCISTTAEDGNLDSERTVSISAMCTVLLFP